jgi:capsular exopolysaccharide synthesis family protein
MNSTPTFAPLLRAVRKRAALVLAVALVAVGASAAWALRSPKKYRAITTLLIEKPMPTDLGILAPFGALLESSRFASTECQVLESKAVLAEAARRLQLEQWPEFAQLDGERRLTALADGLEVEPRGESALVDVSFVALDPQRAARLVNEVAAVYLDHVSTREKEQVQRDLAAIESELPRLEQSRDAGRSDLERFKQENAYLTFDGRSDLLHEELKQQSAIVQAAREKYDLMRARQSVIDASDGDETSESIGALAAALEIDPDRRTLEQLVELKGRRAELAGLEGTRKAQLETLDAEIARLEQAIEDEQRNAIDGVAFQCEIAREAVESGEKRLDELQSMATELDRAASHYNTLSSRAKDAESLYERLAQRRDELLVLRARSGAASRIFVQDKATPATEPCAPKVPAIVALAAVLGLLLGVAAALVLERLDDRIGELDELDASLETEAIARIPHLPTPAGVGPEIQWMRRAQTFPADEFRKLFLTVGGDAGTAENGRVVSVLSAVPREGKTLVATGLAMAAASAGFKTLLVDGDLKRPRIHDVFSLDGEVGVLDHLAGRIGIDEIVHATRQEHLHVLPAGTPTPDLEKIAQPRMLARLVERLRRDWQVVVIDTSPMLLSADSMVLARHADERLLVASASSSKVGPLRQALGELRRMGLDVRGTVINRFATPPAPYGAYGYVQATEARRGKSRATDDVPVTASAKDE